MPRGLPKQRSRPTAALSIGALARATGVPEDTLRTWERRYGAPVATRLASGHRRYPPAEAARLDLVVRLLQHGHRAGDVVAQPADELRALLQLPPAAAGPACTGDADLSFPDVLQLCVAMDRDGFERELRAHWARLGPLEFLDGFAGPLMTRIGRAWNDGRIEIRHEHFASVCLCDFLGDVRAPFDRQASGLRVAAATLPGDLHVGGMLMASLVMATRGLRVVLLGAQTPPEELLAVVRDGRADAVAVSVSAAGAHSAAALAIAWLRRQLPHDAPLWLGGAGAPAAPRGVESFGSLYAFDRHLAHVV